MQKSLGKIAPGYDANLVVVDGEYFDPKSKIVSVWIEGKEYYIASKKTPTFLGTWSLKYSGSSYDLIIEDPLKTQSTEKQKEFYKAYLNVNKKSVEIFNLDIFESSISFTIDGSKLGLKRLLLSVENWQMIKFKDQ